MHRTLDVVEGKHKVTAVFEEAYNRNKTSVILGDSQLAVDYVRYCFNITPTCTYACELWHVWVTQSWSCCISLLSSDIVSGCAQGVATNDIEVAVSPRVSEGDALLFSSLVFSRMGWLWLSWSSADKKQKNKKTKMTRHMTPRLFQNRDKYSQESIPQQHTVHTHGSARAHTHI